ncbi:uncharacterized protein An07g03910 [Aspergillus niger]|uniref:Contig An07c0100, genomic contig n=2 Tax=Aspergillus niger TaxID=5061 RepID=A2QN00_ASPNC|nr:uncharacterized protein An07g03910 [Aspergillus niger]CAK48141.1 unnamed protein product [Aspergillus niger]
MAVLRVGSSRSSVMRGGLMSQASEMNRTGDIRDDKHESPSDFSLTGKEDQWIERNNNKIRIDSSEVAKPARVPTRHRFAAAAAAAAAASSSFFLFYFFYLPSFILSPYSIFSPFVPTLVLDLTACGVCQLFTPGILGSVPQSPSGLGFVCLFLFLSSPPITLAMLGLPCIYSPGSNHQSI